MNIIDKTVINDGESVYEYSLFSKREGCGIYYGVSVQLYRGGQSTRYVLPDVFTSQAKARLFYASAKRNLITPINMPYFLEDCICICQG